MFDLTERALVAASVDDVWADLTQPARVAAWFWPPRFETVAVINPVVLGRWQVSTYEVTGSDHVIVSCR